MYVDGECDAVMLINRDRTPLLQNANRIEMEVVSKVKTESSQSIPLIVETPPCRRKKCHVIKICGLLGALAVGRPKLSTTVLLATEAANGIGIDLLAPLPARVVIEREFGARGDFLDREEG